MSLTHASAEKSRRSGAWRGTAAGRLVLAYAGAIGMVALATLLAAASERVVPTAGVALIFVIPVVLSAAAFGWWPALAAVLTSAAAFDFFFTEPRLQLVISKPEDVWTLCLLLVVASIVSLIAANARRHARAAESAAKRAGTLHALAHAALSGDRTTAYQSAAEALATIFDSPAIVLEEVGYELAVVGSSRKAALSARDLEAARWCASETIATRSETFPFPEAAYDFWPVHSAAGTAVVLGLRTDSRGEGRPEDEAENVEMVAGYVAAATGPKALQNAVTTRA